MRTLLFFDLPTLTKKNNRDYVKFLKFIKKSGFVMMQESVYTKLSINQNVADRAIQQVRNNVPANGIISVLTITENQFSSIINLLGEMTTDVIISESKIIEL